MHPHVHSSSGRLLEWSTGTIAVTLQAPDPLHKRRGHSEPKDNDDAAPRRHGMAVINLWRKYVARFEILEIGTTTHLVEQAWETFR